MILRNKLVIGVVGIVLLGIGMFGYLNTRSGGTDGMPPSVTTVSMPKEDAPPGVAGSLLYYRVISQDAALRLGGREMRLWDPLGKSYASLPFQSSDGSYTYLISPFYDKNKPVLYFNSYNDTQRTESLSQLDLKNKQWSKLAPDGAPFLSIKAFNGQKIAWCDKDSAGQDTVDATVVVYDINTKGRVQIKDPFACGLGSGTFTFSKDGGKLYYTRGFYELYDATEEERKRLAKENQNGIHVIDLASRTSVLLDSLENQTMDIVFWNDMNIDPSKKIVIVVNPKKDTLMVKGLPAQPADYFDEQTVAKLSTLSTVHIPGYYFNGSYFLTKDGNGIFYSASSDTNTTPEQLGYYDITARKNYFPLTNIAPETRGDIYGGTDKDHLFYAGYETTTNQRGLYQTDLGGNRVLIDSALEVGVFGILSDQERSLPLTR